MGKKPLSETGKKIIREHEKFDVLTKLLPVAVYTTNKEGVIDYYNHAAARLWGRLPELNSPEEKYCGSWKLFDVNGYILPHEKSPMAMALKKKEPVYNTELVIVRPDFTKADVLSEVEIIYDEQGDMTGAINVLFDITERKRIEKDTFHLAAIVESSEDAIISKNLSGDITSWNKGAEMVFGYSAEETIGKNITMIIPDERINEELIIINKIRTGKKVDHFETVRQKKDGSLINVSLTVSPIKNSRGEVIGASKIARNIDEQVKVQEKLKHYNQELRRLNSYKDEFISLASHELKMPLTVVKAHLELLSDKVENNEEKFFIDKTLVHVDKLTYLINEMLDVSKIEERQMKLHPEPFNIEKMLKDCIEVVEVIHPNGSVAFESSAPDDLQFTGDKQRLEQVITNLLNNAMKFSRDKREVKLKLNTTPEHIKIQVIDKGIGIPEHEWEKIFQRFYRMEGISKNIAGLGIGLYVSRQIVEKHNGKIFVEESNPGVGSVFSILLPRNN